MISLNKSRVTSESPDVLLNESCAKLIAKICENPETHKVNSHYNDPKVKTQLQVYHHTKCVYCETDTSAGASFRVDHYRPKKYIWEVDRAKHYGYYWLAYEWTNLLQSCEACNRSKSNHFPLFDDTSRIWHKVPLPDDGVSKHLNIGLTPLTNERRLLLHPELDTVENFLVFNRNGFVIPTIDSNDYIRRMAEESIKIYYLNRGSLIKQRKKKIDRYFSELVDILNDYEDRGATDSALKFLHSDLKKYFKRLLREQDEKEEYSRVGFFMFDKFKEFYTQRLREKGYEDISIVEDFYDKLTT